MPFTPQLGQARKQSFVGWMNQRDLHGFSQEAFDEILEHILADQTPAGCWSDEGEQWELVKTAVVLNSLARLRFPKDAEWRFVHNDQHVVGGIAKGLDFLSNAVPEANFAILGLDIWDTCQALLALNAFNADTKCRRLADSIINQWKEHYSFACNQPNKWTGPAFVAAMIDVIWRYSGNVSALSAPIAFLTSCEGRDVNGNPSGEFPPTIGKDVSLLLWNTSLVLRTMATVPGFDAAIIERAVRWLLDQMGAIPDVAWQSTYGGQAPMFIARSLEGLNAASGIVSRELREEITKTLAHDNQLLESYWRQQPPLGTRKAYTAVVEYFAALEIKVPAGLLVDVKNALEFEEASGDRHSDVEKGLRIVWLTDLHVAEESGKRLYVNRLVKNWFGGLKFVHGTALTQSYQSANLNAIMEHVSELRPNHILVTGDVTNYALAKQFQAVRETFLACQQQIWQEKPVNRLSSKRWTILPGNHDVDGTARGTTESLAHIRQFLEYFGETFHEEGTVHHDSAFPVNKTLPLTEDRRVRVLALDSTSPWPVCMVGVNWRGMIDDSQFARLRDALANVKRKEETVLVALHHHPLAVPEMVTAIEHHFLSLDENTGRQLISLCAQYAAAILHGHFHAYSNWSTPVRMGTSKLSIIGAPCGTMGSPDLEAEFLELREAKLVVKKGSKHGLAVYRHHRLKGEWQPEEYLSFIA